MFALGDRVGYYPVDMKRLEYVAMLDYGIVVRINPSIVWVTLDKDQYSPVPGGHIMSHSMLTLVERANENLLLTHWDPAVREIGKSLYKSNHKE